jgi:hypothetical protein
MHELELAGRLCDVTSDDYAKWQAMSNHDRQLSRHIATLRTWFAEFNEVTPAVEIEFAHDLRADSAFVAAVYGPGGAGTDHMPLWEIDCRAVQILKEICRLINGQQLCEWVHVLEMICELIADIMRDSLWLLVTGLEKNVGDSCHGPTCSLALPRAL